MQCNSNEIALSTTEFSACAFDAIKKRQRINGDINHHDIVKECSHHGNRNVTQCLDVDTFHALLSHGLCIQPSPGAKPVCTNSDNGSVNQWGVVGLISALYCGGEGNPNC